MTTHYNRLINVIKIISFLIQLSLPHYPVLLKPFALQLVYRSTTLLRMANKPASSTPTIDRLEVSTFDWYNLLAEGRQVVPIVLSTGVCLQCQKTWCIQEWCNVF